MSKFTKQRSDSWAAALEIEDQWKTYAKFRRWSWDRVAAWVAKEYGIEAPSRSALYRWRDSMRSQESTRRIENAVIAESQVGEIAGASSLKDPILIDAYKSMAAELALTGNVQDAVKYTNMALALAAQQTKQIELELKTAAQQTKEEALQLAREKFEFDAAKAALKNAEQIKGIFQDNTLDTDAKILATRKALFGDDVPQ